MMRCSFGSLHCSSLVEVSILVITLLVAFAAHGTRIRVAQESEAGAGDFQRHILGHIGVFASGAGVDETYAYNEFHRFSFNGKRPVLRANVSRLFFVDTREGLTLFIVHDSVDDPDGGSASMRIQVARNRSKTRLLLRDDAFSQNDSYDVNEAGTDFSAWQSWYPCCTDGLVLGPFSGSWKIYVQFTGPGNLAGTETVRGLQTWEALSDRDRIPLALERGRRVLLEPVSTFVSRPTSDSGRLKAHLDR